MTTYDLMIAGLWRGLVFIWSRFVNCHAQLLHGIRADVARHSQVEPIRNFVGRMSLDYCACVTPHSRDMYANFAGSSCYNMFFPHFPKWPPSKIVNDNFNFIKLIIFTQFLCHTTFIAILKLVLCEKGTGVEILML